MAAVASEVWALCECEHAAGDFNVNRDEEHLLVDGSFQALKRNKMFLIVFFSCLL